MWRLRRIARLIRGRRKLATVAFVLVAFIFAVTYQFYVSRVTDPFPYALTTYEISLKEWKSIRNNSAPQLLFWTPYFGTHDLSFIGIQDSTFANCPEPTCSLVTFDKDQLHKSDAVLFHARDIDSVALPPFHDPDQVWIFLLQEAPTHTNTDLRQYSNIFNWTMTYRQDSDVYYPYAQLTPKPKANYLTAAKAQQLISKPKLVAWIVSHCITHSNREGFVRELQKYLDVDIYGACGSYKCPSDNVSECYEHIATQYKFYLSLENSLCTDYVTEKYFDALQVDIVPVVYGRMNYSRISPPKSFIDIRQYGNNVAELAKYLLHLNSHDEEYLQYFKWKDAYQIVPSNSTWCQLCKKIPNNKGRQHYGDIDEWWVNEPPAGPTDLTPSSSAIATGPACLERPKYTWFDRIVQIFV